MRRNIIESEFPYYLLLDRRILSNREYWEEGRQRVKQAAVVKDHPNPEWLRANMDWLITAFLREQEGWVIGYTTYRYRWMVREMTCDAINSSGNEIITKNRNRDVRLDKVA